MIGRVLGPYEILDSLGIGGMGEVYLAVDTRLERKVALKVLSPDMAGDRERLQRFEREAKAIAALNHPNIVTLYAIEEIDGLRFFTMEVVDGKTLGALRPADGFTLKRFFQLAVPLTDALAAAHDRQITHRDLKPANVMVDGEGRVKVLDFGLAKVEKRRPESGYVDAAAGAPTRSQRPAAIELEDDRREGDRRDEAPPPSGLTEVGRILGTGPYMSPEQVRGLAADPRSDVFALGILLYEMLYGRRPFQGDTYPALMHAIVHDPPPGLDAPPEHWPDGLEDVLRRCLEKDPERRFTNAGELRDVLRRMAQDFQLSVSLSQGDLAAVLAASRPTRVQRWQRVRPWLAVGAVLVLVVLLVMAGIWLDRRASGRAAAETRSPPEPELSALAVLTFRNPNRDPELDWLRLGLAEMLVTDLSRLSEIDVLASDRLATILDDLDPDAGDDARIGEVVRQSGVGLVVTGSFSRSGERLLVRVELRETAGGTTLMATDREGPGTGSVFALVDELSEAIRLELATTGVGRKGARRGIREVTTASMDAYRLYVEASRLHYASRDAETVERLEQALTIDPDFALALTFLSTLYANLGEERLSREAARRAVAIADRLPAHQRYLVAGRYYSAQWQSYDRAVEAYEKAVELYPREESARSGLALLYVFLERYGDALNQYRELERRGSRFAPNYHMMALALGAQGRFADGREVLDAYLRRWPDQWFAKMALGWHLTHWGHLDDASHAFAEAAESAPGDAYIRNGRYRVAVLRGDLPSALREARALAASDELYGRWQGLINEAYLCLYEGRASAALELFDRASRVHPEPEGFTAMTLAWAAEARLALDQAQAALELAERAERLGRNEWPERYGLFLGALAHQALGDSASAEEAARELEMLHPPHPSVVELRQRRLLAGLLALERGETERALRALSDAEVLLPVRGLQAHWHILPDHVPVWYALGRAELQAGRPDLAGDWFERITASGVEHLEFPILYVQSFAHLARIYRGRGDADRARQLERRFRAFWPDGELRE